MSREHFDQRVVDDFERDLREALAIELSPDFARQVRARIAARRAPVLWWRFALPIAATCVLVLGLSMWTERSRVQPVITERVMPRDVPLEAERRAEATVVREIPARRTPPVRVSPEAEPLPEPEIIVPPDRALALARLLELARNGSLDEEKLKPVASARPPATLEIAPLVVAPLSVPELETPSGTAQGGADRE